LILELDFSQIAVKGRSSQGNIFTRYAIHKLQMKEKMAGAVEGVKVWFDDEVLRLNHECKGILLGEFAPGEKILIVNNDGTYFLAGTEYSLRFDTQPLVVESMMPTRYSQRYIMMVSKKCST
jgi:hypothetical protein